MAKDLNLALTWDIMNATIIVVRGTSTGKKKLKGREEWQDHDEQPRYLPTRTTPI
jgi:hypothetical protein